MPIKITIFDGAIPMLDEIAKAHYGQGLDVLDHAGTKLRDETRKAFRNSTTRMRQFHRKDGTWQAHGGNISRYKLGRRISHRNKGGLDKVESMEKLIHSYLMVDKMTMVVAGKHPTFTPSKRRDGKVTGSFKKLKAVTKGSYAILKKLNDGESKDTEKDNAGEYQKVRRTKAQHAMFDKMKWKKQNFVEKGRSNAMGEVERIMTEKYQQMIISQINRANVQPRTVVSA